MLEPKNFKYKKEHKRKVSIGSKEVKLNLVLNGEYGLIAEETGRLQAKQLEAGRRVIKKILKKEGKVWLGVFPDCSYTKKPSEVRMGKGKGSHEYWGTVVSKGRVIFEVGGGADVSMRTCLKAAGEKLPIKSRVIKKRY